MAYGESNGHVINDVTWPERSTRHLNAPRKNPTCQKWL